MNDLIIQVAAGVISSVLAPFVLTRLGGGTVPNQQVTVAGHHNSVTQNVDQSQTTLEIIYEQLPSDNDPQRLQSTARQDTPSGNDTVGHVAAFVVVAVVLVLTYLFIWPIAVWAFVGAAVGIALMTAWTAWRTRDTPGPRITATALMLISSAVLLLAAWWTLQGGPGSDISFSRLEAAVSERHPSFSTGLEGRWEVTTTQPGSILTILGVRGFLYVLVQVGAVVCAALVVWSRALDVSGWIALHNLPRNPRNRRLIKRAVHFKELGMSNVIATVLAAVLICGITGGWASTLLEKAQEYQAESLVGDR